MAKWNKSETLLLLTLYEQHPFLYKANDPNFYNKSLRRQKLDDICEELQKVKKEVTVDDIKIKIKTLRTQLRKETRLIRDSKKTAKTPAEVYVPILWSFRHIKFLDDGLEDESSDEAISESNEESTAPEYLESELNYEQEALQQSPEEILETAGKRKRIDNFKEEATKAFEYAKSFAEEILQNRAKRKPETKEETFAKYLCDQLKLIQLEDIYEETTWKILQIVREGIRKDKFERQDMEDIS